MVKQTRKTKKMSSKGKKAKTSKRRTIPGMRKKTSKRGKNIPWSGWKNEKPGYHEKTMMLAECGKRCFLGPNKSYPICKKHTCKVSRKGVYAAYVRASQFHKRKIAQKAKKILSRGSTRK